MTEPHLDDEALSAVLDGQAEPEEDAHADACAQCSARLRALRGASRLVSAPVPPLDPARRDAAIVAALAVADGDIVVSLRRRLPPAWLAAAAAVLVVAAAVVLFPRTADDDTDDTAAVGATQAGAGSQEMAADSAAPFAMAIAAPVDGGDLGELADVELGKTVRDALARQRTAAEPGPGAATSGEAIRCDDRVRAEHPELGQLVFHASGTLDRRPVTVLAYDVSNPDGSPGRAVYVAEDDDCLILDQRSLPAEP